ncbi:MAG: DUF2281 domain-containing protein [Treponema sp.]|nr:DUF2281 domain-containing protein [Treponema sp.]
MSYEALEKQIRALPETAQQEVAHYVGYLLSLYNAKAKTDSITERINKFMLENPTAFDEFSPVQEAGIEAIRELTKNDEW